ncbi:hypothetical protein ACS0TY_024368 [Phlomoides rotata]
MGHYARILVEIDMRNELIEKIMYKRAGVCSFANITYERLPDFCRGCSIVGHTTTTCSQGRRSDGSEPKQRKRSTSGHRHHRSSLRQGRSASRRRDSSRASDQHTNLGQDNVVDDVLYTDTTAMQGNYGEKILALPPIPTENPFDILHESSDFHEGDTSTTFVQHEEVSVTPTMELDA